jgi:hypothetical protein
MIAWAVMRVTAATMLFGDMPCVRPFLTRPWAMVLQKASCPVVLGGSSQKYGRVARSSSVRDWLVVPAAPISLFLFYSSSPLVK